MAGPWEDFQPAASQSGPWEDFQQPAKSSGMFGAIANWWKSQPSWLEQAEAIHKASNPNSIRPTEAEIDFASGMAGAAPIAGRAAAAFSHLPVTPAEVTLTKGMETGNPELWRTETMARRGLLGDAAKERADLSDLQRAQEVQGVKERIGQSFGQLGQAVAQSPQEAAATAQGGIQRAAQSAKAGVDAQFDQFRQLAAGSAVSPGAVNDLGGQIRSALSTQSNPVVIDKELTPWASKALSKIDNLGDVQNRASMPGAGVDLNSIDQARKQLVALRNGAWGNNASDGRAASAVVNAFDDHLNRVFNSPAFSGDPQAVQIWNDARAAHARFKQTFSEDNPAGRKIQNIIGRRGNDPLTPNDVADALYGKSGTDPGTPNVGIAVRVKNILGEQSPEWSAVKQGLWRRLTEKGEGQPEMEPGTIATRLMKFLNADGRDMANAVYSPQERQMIKNFAELQRKLQPVAGGINRPETSTFVLPMLKKISTNMAAIAGFALAHGFGLGGIGEAVAGLATGAAKEFVGNGMNLRKVNAQMPLANEALDKWQRALAAYNKANSPPSRVALSTATMNLGRAFKPLGITFDGVLPATGSTPAAADEKNP